MKKLRKKNRKWTAEPSFNMSNTCILCAWFVPVLTFHRGEKNEYSYHNVSGANAAFNWNDNESNSKSATENNVKKGIELNERI